MFSGVELDAIVLLGCRVGRAGQHSAPAQRRAEYAARAFAEGIAPFVLISGGRRWKGVPEAEALGVTLESLGVPPDRIVRELCSLSTCENARFSCAILRERGARRIGVVTCEWHMPRALKCFEREGFSAQPLPVPSTPLPKPMQWLRSRRERLSFWVDAWITWGVV